jgi:hypothetical protein
MLAFRDDPPLLNTSCRVESSACRIFSGFTAALACSAPYKDGFWGTVKKERQVLENCKT